MKYAKTKSVEPATKPKPPKKIATRAKVRFDGFKDLDLELLPFDLALDLPCDLAMVKGYL